MREIKSVRELLCWAYADLSAAHKGIDDAGKGLTPNRFKDREWMYKKYFSGAWAPRPLLEEEREKMEKGQVCHYCEKPFPSGKGLQGEHILPTSRGGLDKGENIIWACQSCNGSKGKWDKDFITWALSSSMGFPPIGLIRHYLKLVWEYCEQNGLMEKDLAEVKKLPVKEIPFDWDSLKLGSSTCPYPANVSLREWTNK